MSPRFSQVRRDHIEYSFWLVFDADGGMRFSRGEPSLSRGERAMSCTSTLPRSLFAIPTLKATIGIDQAVASEFKIDVSAASEALKLAVGADIDLRITPSDAPA